MCPRGRPRRQGRPGGLHLCNSSVSQTQSRLAIFGILRQQIAFLKPFKSHFARVWSHIFEKTKLLKFECHLKELNCSTSIALLTYGSSPKHDSTIILLG